MPEGDQPTTLQEPQASTPEQIAASAAERNAAVHLAEAQLSRMLGFRRQYDQRRSAFYRQYLGQQDRRMFPDNVTPRSNTFVAYPLSNVETIVSRVMDAFFSFDPWFEAKGRGAQDEPAAEAMQLVLHYKLRRAKLVQVFEELVKNIAIYGFGGIKVDWDWDFDIGVDPQPQLAMQIVPDPQTGEPMQVPVPDPATGQPIILGINPVPKRIPRSCPKFTAIDVYDLLIDPDGGLKAQLTEKTWGQMQREAENNPQLYYPEGLAELGRRLSEQENSNEILVRVAELWNEAQGTCTLLTFGKDSEALSWKDLRASFRQASYSTYKRKMYGGPAILLWHGEIAMPHKRAPILCTSYLKLPNEIFGLGAVEIISDLTESLNRFTNMVADNWNLGINRRYAYDINTDIDHAALNMFNVPGGKVGVSGNPNEAIFPLPFFTPQRGDYAVLDLYRSMIEMTSGVSDFYAKGIGSPTGNRTATGINQLVNESNFRFKLFIRNLELDILQPLLEMCSSNVQNYMTDAEEIEITDAPVGINKWPLVKPEELIGNFNFDLVAANYATNKVIRQRNLLAFLNIAIQSPFFNAYEGIKEFAKLYEIRGINRLLFTQEQVAMQQAEAQKREVQMLMLEAMLQTESKARLSQAKPRPAGGKEGRPAKAQFEGKIPGAGLTSHIRDLAQSMGVNAFGLSGMGELGEG